MAAPRRENDSNRVISHVRVVPRAESADRATDWYTDGGRENLQTGTGPQTWQASYNEGSESASRNRAEISAGRMRRAEIVSKSKAAARPTVKIDSRMK